MKAGQTSTHAQILKSSAMIGGSTAISVVMSVIRTKAMAWLLGPAGMGLFGNFGTTSDLVRTIAGMGIKVSGVRQIAEAVGAGEAERIARTVTALRRVALITGALGGLLLAALCVPVSRMIFDDSKHAAAVALLGLAVFFTDVSEAQAALVQGMRRIGDLARMSIWGAIFGTVFSIPIVYFWREAGVVPSLVCVAAMTILMSWWYARKIQVQKVSLTWKDLTAEAGGLLHMGVVIMVTQGMTMGVAFLVRVIITHQMSITEAGLYQSAWVLGGVYMGYIVTAMGADFYPRLTAIAKDDAECNRLVNEQVEVGLLVATPGVLASLAFAPLVVHVFYTDAFQPAVDVLRWICVGMLLRVTSWPMGYYLLARGVRRIYFWSELTSNLVYLALIWFCISKWHLTGAGIAFFGMYILYTLGMYVVVNRLSGFRWSAGNMRILALFLPLLALVFLSRYWLSSWAVAGLGGAATLLAGIYSLRSLCTVIPLARLPRAAQKLLAFFRMTPVGSNI